MPEPISVDPRLGTRIAGYLIEGLLGRGGMSVVYVAEHLRLKRKVALKLLAPELATDTRFRERFLRESELAASIDHPNIVPIYDAGEAEGLLYIAMRYVDGTDLRRLLAAEGALEPARAIALLEQVASALDAAHDRGLVHRDVKPANVLVVGGPSGEHAYLTDFGLTKQATSESGLTETGQFLGTAGYVAPEQIERRPVTARADIYSLGCVLYECLAGEAPFSGDSLMGVLWGHLHEPPPSLDERRPELPAGIDTLVATAMAKEPAERFGSCRELIEAARAELVPSRGAPEAQPRRRRRLLVLLAVAVVAVAAAIPAIVLTRGGGREAAAAPPVLSANSLARIDPATNEVVAAVRVGIDPQDVALGGGAAWVGNVGDKTVSRIDTATNAVTRTVSVPFVPSALAFGENALWAAGPSGGEGGLMEIDPRTGRVQGSFALGRSDPVAVSIGEGAIWVAAKDDVRGPAVLRVDPGTGRVIATIPLPPRSVTDASTGGSFLDPQRPSDIAVGAGAVWLTAGASPFTTVVTRIDPATNRVAKTIALDDAFAVSVADGAVWVSGPGLAVSRIDPATNEVVASIPAGNVSAISAGHGAVWVVEWPDEVMRVDPRSGKVAAVIDLRRWHLDQNPSPSGIAADSRAVWLAIGL
jgi:YVTN family beta-propeller protein